MSYKELENGVNEEQITSYLKDVLTRVEADSDPETLNTLKKIFKKNIPFSRRMYVAAYLVRQANTGYKGSRFGGRNERFSRDRTERFDRRNDRTQRTSRPANKFEHNDRPEHSENVAERTDRTERPPRVQIDASLATTIFIGIGRNRHVFPRDLVGLLVSVAGLDRERIGDIRVLASYSFVQLFTEDCEKTIAALNGYDYRGRKLSVSYSRQREDGENVPPEGVNADDSSASSNETSSTGNSYSAAASEEQKNPSASSESCTEEKIPENVSNDSHSVHTESSEESQIAAEQKAFAAEQKTAPGAKPADVAAEKPFSETTDDGQVKSHFGSGNAGSNYLV